MLSITPILAQASAAPETVEVAEVAAQGPATASVVVVGFLFVMVVLSLLAATTSAIGAFFIKQAARDTAKAAEAAEKAASASAANAGSAAAPAPAPAGEEGAEDDPRVLAVIAAAVHSVMGDRPHRVVAVRSAGPGWAQEGRRQIFSSHRVR
jgi:Na+-transporting methylmalonyl-CoA/oxaloacetate decarboxylase gamma subunit